MACLTGCSLIINPCGSFKAGHDNYVKCKQVGEANNLDEDQCNKQCEPLWAVYDKYMRCTGALQGDALEYEREGICYIDYYGGYTCTNSSLNIWWRLKKAKEYEDRYK